MCLPNVSNLPKRLNSCMCMSLGEKGWCHLKPHGCGAFPLSFISDDSDLSQRSASHTDLLRKTCLNCFMWVCLVIWGKTYDFLILLRCLSYEAQMSQIKKAEHNAAFYRDLCKKNLISQCQIVMFLFISIIFII